MMQRKESGFSIIEVLIALLITAVGILGVAGLQVMSLQQNRSALLRDQALQAANDILDRMRANPATDYAPVAMTDAPVSDVNCVAATCNPVEMAEYDIAQWKCRLNPFDSGDVLYEVCDVFNLTQVTLIGGAGSIALVGKIQVITVEWVDDKDGSTSSIVLNTQIEE
ncbi:MAG: type IV pilus modification protein PilV [bacterium]|nr:type IV pilus modification protein PilV [Gammaproteobacteria bacterium]HIL96548.1 type IV pilus modification protein PilV [Pseudomonadales bacterium]